MIEVNSLKKAPDNIAASAPSLLKAELDDAKKNKGTELAGREPVDVQDVAKKDQQDKRDLIAEVKENLEKLNEYIPVTATNLVFEFDELGDPPVIKVFDKESNEIIREIPTKEFREVAKALDEFADKLTNKGLLVDSSV
ncbi:MULTISPECIES: flagellar protein FlaG [Pseudoalteromonas]|uniref:Flagellar biosynthesis protein FlaG n=1 Tax=Pseudoalteromonas lipolytica TaxID=570156 RepID=A0A0P7E036_9GAMM|nr:MULTISPECIES: flagellar protein FlaG [Pseudoalteromonas]KPM83398.1 flagellar biosynthesis protein FlaG [Pseudoalteromonas lipolytica]|tara:strand:+ start:999 stop:1415 length:417 start_codon:yes stop_codon:yes gene_type:complete